MDGKNDCQVHVRRAGSRLFPFGVSFYFPPFLYSLVNKENNAAQLTTKQQNDDATDRLLCFCVRVGVSVTKHIL